MVLPRASDAEIDLIRETIYRRGVAFLHDQHLSPEEHIAFAERIGLDRGQPLLPALGALIRRSPGSRRPRPRPPTSAAAGTPTTAMTRRRPWARSCWRSRPRPAAATPSSPTCTPPTRRCRTG